MLHEHLKKICLMYAYRMNGPMDFEGLKNSVTLDLEKTEEKLMHR